MAYSGQIVSEEQVRIFFQPRLSEEEYSSPNLLAKIKAIEYFVNKKYGVSLAKTDEHIVQATIMMIAAKIGSEPRVQQRRLGLTREAWVTQKMSGEGGDPYSIVKKWECDAYDIFRTYLPATRNWAIVNK